MEDALRLDELLRGTGRWTRREAFALLAAGRVTLDGQSVTAPSLRCAAGADVRVDGEAVRPEPPLCLMLHKPAGYLTATVSDREPPVTELLPPELRHLFPVGRLDLDTEGLLLLTNDGEFANRLMHPRHEIEKTYLVRVSGFQTGAEDLLRRPIRLDGAPIRPPKVRLLAAEGSAARLEIVIHEGRNRQVRRMCEAAGLRVLRLRRIAEGGVRLGDLPPGRWRELTEQELRALRF